jgi:hypothetical protein
MVILTHFLHQSFGRDSLSARCGFQKWRSDTLSLHVRPIGDCLACAQRGWQGDATGLKDLARYAGSLAAKDVALSADRNFHLNKVVQTADYVGPFQFPFLVRQTVFQFFA